MTLIYPCSDGSEHYKTHPLHYISHLIGHEGKGSILSVIKEKGWSLGLTAGLSSFGAAGFEFFKISVDLTSKGLGSPFPFMSRFY